MTRVIYARKKERLSFSRIRLCFARKLSEIYLVTFPLPAFQASLFGMAPSQSHYNPCKLCDDKYDERRAPLLQQVHQKHGQGS
jgi:hypothetical protein